MVMSYLETKVSCQLLPLLLYSLAEEVNISIFLKFHEIAHIVFEWIAGTQSVCLQL